jgi:hypothetical protein
VKKGIIALALAALVLAATAAGAEEPKHRKKAHVGDTVKEAAKTGGHAARDGALTFGRSTRDFFKGGPDAAKKTWRKNAATTKSNAKAGAARTRAAAHGESD